MQLFPARSSDYGLFSTLVAAISGQVFGNGSARRLINIVQSLNDAAASRVQESTSSPQKTLTTRTSGPTASPSRTDYKALYEDAQRKLNELQLAAGRLQRDSMSVLAQNESLRAENARLSELHADAARRLSDYQLGLTNTLPPALQDDSWLVG